MSRSLVANFRPGRGVSLVPIALGGSLAGQYFVASLIVLIASIVVLGIWVGDQIQEGVVDRTAGITALYIDSFIAPHLQSLASQPELDSADEDALAHLLTNSPLGDRIVAFKVWSLDGEILYSTDPRLVGRRFPIQGGLIGGVRGEVSGELSDLDEAENVYERQRWSRLLEVYVPVRERSTGRLLAVAEFYELPDDLDREIMGARLRSWGVVIAVIALAYLLLAGIVRRGSDTITRQRAELETRIAELTALLDQNARLRERLRRAAGRATAINEQSLRRISGDLHDGPAQSLALASLRLDALQDRTAEAAVGGDDFSVVKSAIEEALREIRAIAAGLRLPELAPLTVRALVERAADGHRRLTGTPVDLAIEDVPEHAPLAIKIALFRALQETLSNATRHGGGANVRATVSVEGGFLRLDVRDDGAGFDPSMAGGAGRLGLAGLREQAELLGGRFDVASEPGRGALVRLWWPLARTEGSWPI